MNTLPVSLSPESADGSPLQADAPGRDGPERSEDVMEDAAGAARASTGEAAAPVPVAPAKPAAPRATRARPKPPVDAKPAVPAPKVPFKMSYDGTTEKDYIAHIIRLGAR